MDVKWTRWWASGFLSLWLLLMSGCAPSGAPMTASPPRTVRSVIEPMRPTPWLETSDGTADTVMGGVAGLEEALTTLYRRANPAVVYILVTDSEVSPFLTGSSGSGFVYHRDGLIVTNSHVTDMGDVYEVVFWNGERQLAELMGADADSDLAVLRVAALPDGVRPLRLAERSVEVGQLVVAIGSPFGEQGSMSLGIVSGLGRSLPSQRAATSGGIYALPGVIQTDAPINPGNSGGPLLSLAGEVIGVNTAIASVTGVGSGVGFAIPAAVVRRVVPALIEAGEVVYPYVGATFDNDLTLAKQALYELPQVQGAYVLDVVPGGPADRAGVIPADPRTGRGGDLIIAIDGRPVNSFSDLNAYLVLEGVVGDSVGVKVLRGGREVDLEITLGRRP